MASQGSEIVLFLGVRLHAALYPSARRLGLLVELLLGHLELLKRSVRRGDVAALFEAGALKEGEEPLLEVGELFNVDTGPFYRHRLAYSTLGFIGVETEIGNVLDEATQPQQEMSAMVTRSPTR